MKSVNLSTWPLVFSTSRGVSDVQSTSSMFSVSTKWRRQKLSRLALTAQPGGPKSYRPATPP
jgi:hypothetical protein